MGKQLSIRDLHCSNCFDASKQLFDSNYKSVWFFDSHMKLSWPMEIKTDWAFK